MKKLTRFLYLLLILVLFYGQAVQAQTSGKIAGFVRDANTEEPLAGANVLVENTALGAAVGLDGSFFILNVPPGTYTVSVEMIGYEKVSMEGLQVSVNRTAYVNVSLNPAIMEGEVIVVQADKIATKKDQTGSMKSVTSDQMEILPVESMEAVVSMQAGVVDGHFRGGRRTEVSYMIDGLQVDDAFGGESRSVDIETETIQELEVVTGTFNAEYGRAMSGIVNAVTKDGGNEFHGSFSSSAASYITGNSDIFPGLDEFGIKNQDYKFQLSGPILPGKLAFFFNTRYQDNDNHLNGIRRFNVDDYSNFSSENEAAWISIHTGDEEYVPMNNSINQSFLGKLTYWISPSMRTSLLYTRNQDEWHSYDHAYKYVPDGNNGSYRTTDMYALNFNHTLSNQAFYEMKLSYMDNYDGWFLYEDPTDERYIHDIFLRGTNETGFYTGGQQKDHSRTWQKDINFKLDFTWQINNRHSMKTGLLYIYHDLENKWSEIKNKYEGTELDDQLVYEPIVYPNNSVYSDFYNVKPVEYAYYIQDKMEYEDMVMNFGVRLDYFDPKAKIPSDRRNPANQLLFGQDSMSTYIDAEPQMQISPRLGLAYQLGRTAVLHFSYGHFFQMPPMYAMYQNNSLLVSPTDYSTTMGNPELKAQKTVQYEIGLWQELMEGMGLEISLYYRDIYDLLSARVVSTYNQIEYGLYSNKDYGNAKGLELKYDLRMGSFQTFVNYTLQYTRGNADNPTTTFDRAGSSRDPINKLIPLSWDQRHTFNATVGYYTGKYGVTMTGYYNSGSPYTWTPLAESLLSRVNLYENNDHRPATYTVDLNAYYNMDLFKHYKLNFTLSVYNLFDRLNENWVNSTTGRAYTAIIQQTDLLGHRSNFNDYEDRVQNPSAYAAPRLVKLGMGVSF